MLSRAESVPNLTRRFGVKFEHAANLHTVEFVITAYQYFFHQFYDDIGPFEKTLANKLA
jgi:hypothetical protein